MTYPPGHYDDKQVRAMTELLADVCTELGVNPADQQKREWIAMVLLVCSYRAPYDSSALQVEVVRQCRAQEAIERLKVEPEVISPLQSAEG